MRDVITFFGPTASGKTGLAIAMAKAILQELSRSVSIINFDSLLFYKGLDIGTAKPTLQERQGVPHYMIDVADPKDPLNAADYCHQALELINKLPDNEVIFLVGGSGFYLRALIKGMFEEDQLDRAMQSKAQEYLETHGPELLWQRLKECDPESATLLHPNDHYRVTRAYDYFLMTGRPISTQRRKLQEQGPYDFTQTIHTDWRCLHLYLDLEKDKHLEIIQKRTWSMLEKGILQEVNDLMGQGLSGEERPLNSIGYKEAQERLKGVIKSDQEYVEKVVISTRQLAKAQRTFFKKIKGKNTYNSLTDSSIIKEDIFNFLKEHGQSN